MYNRYIPQSDGTYRRNRVQEHTPPPDKPQERPFVPPQEPEPRPQQQQQPHQQQQRQRQYSAPPPKQNYQRQRQEPHKDGNVLHFLRQLLPKDFDTGDLLVVILLLLISADNSDDQNTALLTLALYLFM